MASGQPGAGHGQFVPPEQQQYQQQQQQQQEQHPGQAPMMHQGGGYPGGTGMPADAFGAMGGNAAMANLGLQMFQSGQQQVMSNASKYVSVNEIKQYFKVDTRYVARKLKLLLFPLRHQHWARTQIGDGYAPPRDDINAPDLYIPTMAFITYILVLGFAMGMARPDDFQPDVLGMTGSSALGVVLFEIAVYKLAFYLLSARTSVTIYDLIAYSGYKFAGLVVSCAVGILLGKTVYTLVLLATSTFMAMFLVKTLRLVVLPDTMSASAAGSSNLRNYFLLFMAALQYPIAFFLGVGHLLNASPAAAAVEDAPVL